MEKNKHGHFMSEVDPVSITQHVAHPIIVMDVLGSILDHVIVKVERTAACLTRNI